MEVVLHFKSENYTKGKDVLLSDDAVGRASLVFKEGSIIGKDGYYCYDEKTEVLTHNGFKKFNELAYSDEIATLNPETQEIEYLNPVKIHKFEHNGEMVHIKGKSYDFLVTPDHKIYCEFGRKGARRKWQFIDAIELFKRWRGETRGGFRLKRTAKWRGKDIDLFILPRTETTWKRLGAWEMKLTPNILDYAKGLRKGGLSYPKIANHLNVSYGNLWKAMNWGKRGLTKIWDEKAFQINLWLKFFGWFLGEGWTDSNPQKGNYKIVIAQSIKNKNYRNEIREILDNLKISYVEGKDGFSIFSKQLWSYLRQFGKSKERLVPQWIKELSPRYLTSLIESLTKAEGGYRTSVFTTSSKRLADDFQECLLKIGLTGTIYKHEKRGLYYISISRERKDIKIGLRPKLINYKGLVYDVTMPKNHIILVRRNGKIAWGSNCYLSGTEEQCKRALELIKELAEEVKDETKSHLINKIKEEEERAISGFGNILG